MSWWQTLCTNVLLSFLEAAPIKLKGKEVALLITVRDGIDRILSKQAP